MAKVKKNDHQKKNGPSPENERKRIPINTKKIYTLLIIAAVFIIGAFIAISFINKNETDVTMLYGEWTGHAESNDNLTVDFYFSKDQKVKYYVGDNVSYEGVWTYEDNADYDKVVLKFEDLAGVKDLYVVKDEKSNEYVLSYYKDDLSDAYRKK